MLAGIKRREMVIYEGGGERKETGTCDTGWKRCVSFGGRGVFDEVSAMQ